MVIKVPENLERGKAFSLSDVSDLFFEQCLGTHGFCRLCDNTFGNLHNRWLNKSARVVNAPEILVFDVDRAQQIPQMDGSFKETRALNRLMDDEFNLRDFRPRSSLPLGADPQLEGSKYRRIGVLGYVGGFNHCVAVVTEGADHTGDWVYYDDTLPGHYSEPRTTLCPIQKPVTNFAKHFSFSEK